MSTPRIPPTPRTNTPALTTRLQTPDTRRTGSTPTSGSLGGATMVPGGLTGAETRPGSAGTQALAQLHDLHARTQITHPSQITRLVTRPELQALMQHVNDTNCATCRGFVSGLWHGVKAQQEASAQQQAQAKADAARDERVAAARAADARLLEADPLRWVAERASRRGRAELRARRQQQQRRS